MTANAGTPLPDEAILRIAAEAGLDVSDAERAADLCRRVSLMRQGLGRLYEIDVSGAESPSAFVPVRT